MVLWWVAVHCGPLIAHKKLQIQKPFESIHGQENRLLVAAQIHCQSFAKFLPFFAHFTRNRRLSVRFSGFITMILEQSKNQFQYLGTNGSLVLKPEPVVLYEFK
jgi:hypothetical protein